MCAAAKAVICLLKYMFLHYIFLCIYYFWFIWLCSKYRQSSLLLGFRLIIGSCFIFWCRLISRLWEIAGTRYENPKLVQQSASALLSDGDSVAPLEFWNCQTSGGTIKNVVVIIWSWMCVCASWFASLKVWVRLNPFIFAVIPSILLSMSFASHGH